MKATTPLFAAALTLVLTNMSAPAAAMMTFTHAGTGSGTLNGVGFSNAEFTITGRGDLVVDFSGGHSVDHDSASIYIRGLGTYDFLSTTRTFVHNGIRIVGFSRSGVSGRDLFNGPNSALFSSWNMQTEIPTVSGSGNLTQWGTLDIMTTGGVLFFQESFFQPASFSAAVVPEPASAVLLGCGASALLARRRSPGCRPR